MTKIPPKPSKQTIYVDVDDEITAIIDKVEAAKEKVVAVVLPKRANMLQSTVNMRLLKKAADSASKNVVLITNEAALLPLAGIAGLHVAKNLQSKPAVPPEPGKGGKHKPSDPEEEETDVDAEGQPHTLDYHRSIGELAATHAITDEPETIDLEDDEPDVHKKNKKAAKSPGDKKLKVPDFDRFRLRLFLIAAAGVGLIVFLVLAIFVLPKATVVVKTTSVPVSASFSLTTSDTAKALDENAGVIPATVKTSDQTIEQQVQATGQQNNGEKATGSVTFRNCNTSGQSATVPAGTGVSANGMTYVTASAASMPNSAYFGSCQSGIPNTTATVNITAQVAGAKYNIGSTAFSVSGYSSVTASGSASGGTDDIATVVAQSDLDKVKQQITSESSDTFTKAFQDQLAKENLYALSSTLKLSDPQVSSTPAVGQPASTVKVTVKVTYSVLTVKKDDLTKVVTDELNKKLDKSKQKLGTTDVLDGLTIDVQNQTSPAVVTLNISQETTAVPIIDVTAVKKQAAGQKTSTIKSSLSSVAGVENVEVHLSPFWVSKAPKNTSKITVVQEQVKTSQNSESP